MRTDKLAENAFHIECIKNPPLTDDTHIHDTFLIYYCQRGRFINRLEHATARFIHGDIVILPPDTMHQIRVDAPYTVYFVLSFSSDFLDASSQNSELFHTFLQSLQTSQYVYPKVFLPPEEIVFFECMLDRLMREYTEANVGYTDILKNGLLTLLTILSRIYSAQDFEAFTQSYSKKKSIEYCISYIDAHCCENITLPEITRLSTMSKTAFCDLFKKQTGLSFKDYLNRKRIQKALALLKTNDNITEISYACGYNEFTTFYRNFIKFTGMTPQQYRLKQKRAE